MRVIVTGSEGLIGKEVVKYLRNLRGYWVACCDSSLDSHYDLTVEENVKEIFKTNKADALVNCYAYNPSLPSCSINEFSLDEFRRYMEINVVSLFNVCREFIRNNSKGAIVNFSSIYGVTSPNPLLYFNGAVKDFAYGVSKAGVINLTKQFAVNYPNHRINTIVPGGVYNNQDEGFVTNYKSQVPLHRMMKAEEISPLVEFLINPEKNSYITGACFTIDGGYTA